MISVGNIFPGQVVLACIRKEAKQAMETKPLSSVPPCFLRLHMPKFLS